MCCGVRVRVGVQGRGRRERILMTPPLFQIGLYYHASIFVEFENVRHYHMYSKVYSKEHSNTYSTVYSNELSSIEVSLECIVSNVTVASTTRS